MKGGVALVVVMVSLLIFLSSIVLAEGTSYLDYRCNYVVDNSNSDSVPDLKVHRSVTMEEDLACQQAWRDFFIIEDDDITINCNGHSITSYARLSGNTGFRIRGNNVVIENCILRGFENNIVAEGAENLILRNNVIEPDTNDLMENVGISIRSPNALLENNVIRYSQTSLDGIVLGGDANDAILRDNVVIGANKGIRLNGVVGLTLQRNNFTGGDVGMELVDVTASTFEFNKIGWNQQGITVDDGSIANRFLDNKIKDNAEVGILLEASDTTFNNNFIENSETGLWIKSERNNLLNNKIEGNNIGIYIENVPLTTITAGRIKDNQLGLFFDGSTRSLIQRTVFENNLYGINLSGGEGNEIIDVEIISGNRGIIIAENNQQTTLRDVSIQNLDRLGLEINGISTVVDGSTICNNQIDLRGNPHNILGVTGSDNFFGSVSISGNWPTSDDFVSCQSQEQCEMDNGQNGVVTWSYKLPLDQQRMELNGQPLLTGCCLADQCAAGTVAGLENVCVDSGYILDGSTLICENTNWQECIPSRNGERKIFGSSTFVCSNNGEWENCDFEQNAFLCGVELTECKISGWEPGVTYNLVEDIFSEGRCFNIDAPDVTLDCGGYEIRGSGGGAGVEIQESATDVTIKNCAITNFDSAVFFAQTTLGAVPFNTVIERNNITNSQGLYAIHMKGSGIILKDNIIENNNLMGVLVGGSNHELFNNKICGHDSEDGVKDVLCSNSASEISGEGNSFDRVEGCDDYFVSENSCDGEIYNDVDEEIVEEDLVYTQGDQCIQEDNSDGVWVWSYMLNSETSKLQSNQEPERTACCAQGECTDIRGQCRSEGIWWEAGSIGITPEYISRYICEDSNWYDCTLGPHDDMVVAGQTYTCVDNKWVVIGLAENVPEQEEQLPIQDDEVEDPVEEEIIEELACVDSDPFNDPFIQGRLDNARHANGNLIGAPRLDSCLNSRLVQVDCVENIYTQLPPEDCVGQCVNGRCQEPADVQEEEQEPEELLGDVDGDALITEDDALLVFNHVAGVSSLTVEQQNRADVNYCQQVGITNIDGILIQRKVRNIIQEFPCD
jgi:nitrous oxidase accessory protein NosD